MKPSKLSPNQKARLKLIYAQGFGTKKLEKLISIFKSEDEIIKSSIETLQQKGNLKINLAKEIYRVNQEINIEKEISLMEKESIEIIFLDDFDYPPLLKELSSPPMLLFLKGNQSLINQNQIAIVGTRRPSDYGKVVCQKLTNELCDFGFVITSGLAQGIDSTAHLVTLERQGKTIAVLGEGILKKQTSYTFKKIFDRIIAENGLIISEYPPNFPAQKYTFPARNRIISGLSIGTLVIEAGEKSGSLITANFALEQGREVFAVPGSIFSKSSAGCHYIIKQGAKLTQSANDILEEFNFKTNEATNKNPLPLIELKDELENHIYSILSLNPLSIDQISKKSKVATPEISAKLSLLEIKGIVQNIGGGRFIKKQL